MKDMIIFLPIVSLMLNAASESGEIGIWGFWVSLAIMLLCGVLASSPNVEKRKEKNIVEAKNFTIKNARLCGNTEQGKTKIA